MGGERFREFHAYTHNAEEMPLGFAIHGEKRIAAAESGEEEGAKFEPFVERFECLPVVPVGILDLFAAGSLGWAGLIEGAVIPEQRERLRELFTSPEYLVGREPVRDIANWIIEELTGRPTKRPAGSPSGPSNPGDTSPEPSGSEESTPEG